MPRLMFEHLDLGPEGRREYQPFLVGRHGHDVDLVPPGFAEVEPITSETTVFFRVTNQAPLFYPEHRPWA